VSRAAIVRGGSRSVIRIDENARDTPWGRFGAAHETGHHVMHQAVDHFEQCAGEQPGKERGGTAYRIERQANDFATELLVPSWLGAPYCAMPRPRFDDVARLARAFTTSLEMSAIRMVQLAAGACAVALVVDGRIKWAPESAGFPGKIVKGRGVDPRAVAARLRPREMEAEAMVDGAVWGGAKGAVFVEQAVRLGARGPILSWIVPAS
jgi:hypothetical protein